MAMLAHPAVAIIFGVFIVCAETCLHFGDIVGPSAWIELPLNDWFAGAFLIYGGVAFRRSPKRSRVIQAAAWGFMCSLLAAAFLAHWEEWRTPSAPSEEWISAGVFLAILLALLIISVLAMLAILSREDG